MCHIFGLPGYTNNKYKLYAKLSKCEFGVQKLEFLSFCIKINKVKPDFKRIYKIIK
jgi:hypothetical protein